MAEHNILEGMRDYVPVATPKYKKDWDGKLLQVRQMPPVRVYDKEFKHQEAPDPLVPDGSVLHLYRRWTNGDGKSACLSCRWPCPCCGYMHERTLPETYVTEGKAEFVEPGDIAVYAKPEIVYLACAYSHEDAAVREARFHQVSKAAAWLTMGGHHVISPISMGHPVSVKGADGSWDSWRHLCLALLRASTQFIVFNHTVHPCHWSQSRGVKAELTEARNLGMPIYHAGVKLGEPYELNIHKDDTWQDTISHGSAS